MTRQLLTGLRALLVLTVLLGVAYPLAVTGVAAVAFPHQAKGSFFEADGQVVGSRLLGQSFLDPDTGSPMEEYFQPRPSAAGDGYDPLASGASNLGPNSEVLLELVEQRRQQVAELEDIDPAQVPVDALTASGSGLDPHISPEYARLQVDRVALARGVPVAQVLSLLDELQQGRSLGFLGAPRVNVLELNLALDAAGR